MTLCVGIIPLPREFASQYVQVILNDFGDVHVGALHRVHPSPYPAEIVPPQGV